MSGLEDTDIAETAGAGRAGGGPGEEGKKARRIREEIYEETGLTASVGVGPSKFVAKVATGQDKSDGLTVIRPEEQMEFIAGFPVAIVRAG